MTFTNNICRNTNETTTGNAQMIEYMLETITHNLQIISHSKPFRRIEQYVLQSLRTSKWFEYIEINNMKYILAT